MCRRMKVRPQCTDAVMKAAVKGLAEAVRTVGQSVSQPRPEDMRVGKAEPCASVKDLDDWDFAFNGGAGTLDPAYPTVLKAARQLATVVMATAPHEQVCVQHCRTLFRCSRRRERVDAGKSAVSCFGFGEMSYRSV